MFWACSGALIGGPRKGRDIAEGKEVEVPRDSDNVVPSGLPEADGATDALRVLSPGATVPSHLTGENRLNRGQRWCPIDPDNDFAAIEEWIRSRKRSEHTIRAYRREANRLMLWAFSFVGKPISELSNSDLASYFDWLEEPELHPDWPASINVIKGIGGHVAEGRKAHLRGLSETSRDHALRVLRAMYSWWAMVNYISMTPTFLLTVERTAPLQHKEKSFPPELWAWLVSHADDMVDKASTPLQRAVETRLRFLLVWSYWCGSRRSEPIAAVMSDIEIDANFDGVWHVKGKGDKRKRRYVLETGAVDALIQYRLARQLPPLPSRGETDIPLVARLAGDSTITGTRVYQILTAWMRRAIAFLPAEKASDWGSYLAKASPHWLRHSYLSHRAPLLSPSRLRSRGRHANVQTTYAYYVTNEEADERAALMELDVLPNRVTGSDRTII